MVGFSFLLVFLANINELRYDEPFILYIMLIYFIFFCIHFAFDFIGGYFSHLFFPSSFFTTCVSGFFRRCTE